MIPEIPKIPRGRLWACLVGPIVSVIIWFLLILLFFKPQPQSDPTAMIWINGFLGVLVLGVSLASLSGFIHLLSKRYSSGNVLLLTLGYLIGQVVVGLGLAVGACFLIAAS